MDEEKFRKAVQVFLAGYQPIFKLVDEVASKFTKDMPIAKEDMPLAVTILEEEIEQSDMSPEYKELFLLITGTILSITGTILSDKDKELTYVS